MKEPPLLYSTKTWLAYAIAERYYDGVFRSAIGGVGLETIEVY